MPRDGEHMPVFMPGVGGIAAMIVSVVLVVLLAMAVLA